MSLLIWLLSLPFAGAINRLDDNRFAVREIACRELEQQWPWCLPAVYAKRFTSKEVEYRWPHINDKGIQICRCFDVEFFRDMMVTFGVDPYVWPEEWDDIPLEFYATIHHSGVAKWVVNGGVTSAELKFLGMMQINESDAKRGTLGHIRAIYREKFK